MRILLSLVLALGVSACGKAAIGETCKADSDCDSKVQCILSGSRQIVSGSPTCVDTSKLCSVTCTKDADCAALGTGYICINECFQGSCLPGSRT